MNPNARHVLRWGLIALLTLVIAWGVWPTLWRYDHACGRLVRINRVTQRVDVLLDQGWYALGNPLDDITRQSESNRRGFFIVSQIVCSPDGPSAGSGGAK